MNLDLLLRKRLRYTFDFADFRDLSYSSYLKSWSYKESFEYFLNFYIRMMGD